MTKVVWQLFGGQYVNLKEAVFLVPFFLFFFPRLLFFFRMSRIELEYFEPSDLTSYTTWLHHEDRELRFYGTGHYFGDPFDPDKYLQHFAKSANAQCQTKEEMHQSPHDIIFKIMERQEGMSTPRGEPCQKTL